MKILTALLVAVVLVSPAFTQKPTPQPTRAISKLHIVAPAAKPLLPTSPKLIRQQQIRP